MTYSNRTIELGDHHQLTYLVGRAAYITQQLKKPGKGGRTSKIKSVYYAFDSTNKARRFFLNMRKKYGKFRVEMRSARRVLDWTWEVKIQGDFELAEIEEIMRSLDTFYPEKNPFPVVPIPTQKPATKVLVNTTKWWGAQSFARMPKRDRRKVASFC
ncbi:MAG: hypothetical protein F6K21_02970 [Symploca sp. SIO2D2]|nr:hypothetical protein [Symploca sp. SIO2D2]NET62032.1 hypothetical protein [Symploca sp. SIO2E6]